MAPMLVFSHFHPTYTSSCLMTIIEMVAHLDHGRCFVVG